MRTITLLLSALLMTACTENIDTNEEVILEIQTLTSKYRSALVFSNSKDADKLQEKINELVKRLRGNGCSEDDFRASAFSFALHTIQMELILARKEKLSTEEADNAVKVYNDALDYAHIRPDQVEKQLESCLQAKYTYTSDSLHAIRNAFQPLIEIDKAAKAYFSPAMWRHAAEEKAKERAYALQWVRHKDADDRRLSECVSEATADPKAAAQISRAEIIAACKSMFR